MYWSPVRSETGFVIPYPDKFWPTAVYRNDLRDHRASKPEKIDWIPAGIPVLTDQGLLRKRTVYGRTSTGTGDTEYSLYIALYLVPAGTATVYGFYW
jgi:hypothetical protein